MTSLTNKAHATARRLRSRVRHQGWLRLPEGGPDDPVVKPVGYLPIYEQLLAPLRRRAFTLLELGVWAGDSLAMWRDAFPRATIVGVDLAPPDLELGARVHIVRGNQTDAALMGRLREEYAPAGFDVVVDDASHLGITTAQSLQVLYAQHLRPGGLYCIEDWGTGYLPDWHDGGAIATLLDVRHLDSSTDTMEESVAKPIPMPSHDLGAVGVIKRLVDHVARGAVQMGQPDLVGEPLVIDAMTVWNGVVALRKPTSQP